MKSFFLALWLIWLGFILVTPAAGFCVYDRTGQGTGALKFKQIKGGNFESSHKPKACCNWQTDSCNKDGGKRTSNITMRVYEFQCTPICRWVKICDRTFDAGGWLTVTGTRGSLKCNGHNVD